MQPGEYQGDFSSSFGVIASVRMDEVIYIVGTGKQIITATIGTVHIWRALLGCDDWIALIRPLNLTRVHLNFRPQFNDARLNEVLY